MSNREAETPSCGKEQSPYKLFALGFCGIDNSISVEDILKVNKQENCEDVVEWGVLFRPEKAGEPRFATMDYVRSLTQKAKAEGIKIRLAAHLCSSRCEEVLKGDKTFVKELLELGFGRVQVNATKANNVNIENLEACIDPLITVMKETRDLEWIIQKNLETKPLWEGLLGRATELPNMSILFDDSVGRGIEISSFPEPFPNIPCGYAGGIGPHNIERVLLSLGKVKSLPERGPWIDMESSLRDTSSGKDNFSLERAKECISHLKDLSNKSVLTL